ncbi:MAG: hypothetical protein IJ189_01050 [Clostridia bacterium]|nr:hypothetical protein [Clostridia bacterium]
MKRLIALLVAALVLFAAVPAMAATLLEKFEGQTVDQGFKGTVTFSTAGEKTEAIGPDAWAWLQDAAPRLSIETTHSFANRSDGQAVIKLLIDGQDAGKTTLLYNSALVGVSSDFLAGGDAWYTAARDWDLSVLLQGLAQKGSAWPPIWRLLAAVENAGTQWQEKASQHFVHYETKLGTWLNGYAVPVAVTEGGTVYTQLEWRIPADDLKAEIKSLLTDFYADNALLSLMREIVTAQEAASYLQPGMLPAISRMVDQLELPGEVDIIRRYSSTGAAVLDQVTLPFAEHQALKTLTISLTPDPDGQAWQFKGLTQNGVDFDVACLVGQDKIFSGSVTILLPVDEEKDDGNFLVVERTAQQRKIAFDFNCTWDEGAQEYSLANDRFTQTLQGTLVIKPHGNALPSQSVTVMAHLSSASDVRSTTRIEATLTWRDLDGDASVTAALTGRTAAPGEVTKLSAIENALRIDLLPGGEYEALVKGWKEHVSSWLQDAAAQLLPAALPAEAVPAS